MCDNMNYSSKKKTSDFVGKRFKRFDGNWLLDKNCRSFELEIWMVVYGWNHLHYICKSGLNSSDGLTYLWDRSVGNHQSLLQKIILTDFEFRTQRMNELSVIGLFYQCGHFHEQENKYRDCEIERRISVYLSFYLITLLRT